MTTLLFLPGPDTDWRWLRIADGRVAEAGEGVPGAGEPVVAVAPADAVTLHWAELPSRSAAQATAAARILVNEASVSPAGDLHVAVGDEGAAERPIAVVGTDAMARWLAILAQHGIDPDALVPAPMLMPRPEQGFWRGEIAGHGVVRGTTSGFADEARLTELVTGGEAPTTLDRDTLEVAIAAAAAAPALDLRQGMFARRRRFAIDWRLVRRLVALGAVVLALTLAIDLVRIVRYNLAADAAEAEADRLSRSGLARGETVTDPSRQLDERLSRLRGPGRGFSNMVAVVYGAIAGQPGAELTGMTFEANGDLRIAVATASEAGPTDVKRAIEAAGLGVEAGTFQSANGRVTGEMTVHGS